jgi:hypothetical protein
VARAHFNDLRPDSESINRGIDEVLPVRRARAYTVQRQLLDMIGHMRTVNALTRSLYGINQRRVAA